MRFFGLTLRPFFYATFPGVSTPLYLGTLTDGSVLPATGLTDCSIWYFFSRLVTGAFVVQLAGYCRVSFVFLLQG